MKLQHGRASVCGPKRPLTMVGSPLPFALRYRRAAPPPFGLRYRSPLGADQRLRYLSPNGDNTGLRYLCPNGDNTGLRYLSPNGDNTGLRYLSPNGDNTGLRYLCPNGNAALRYLRANGVGEPTVVNSRSGPNADIPPHRKPQQRSMARGWRAAPWLTEMPHMRERLHESCHRRRPSRSAGLRPKPPHCVAHLACREAGQGIDPRRAEGALTWHTGCVPACR
jgi:hypothetical protein